MRLCNAGVAGNGSRSRQSEAETLTEGNGAAARHDRQSEPAGGKASQTVDLTNLFAGVWMGDEEEETWSGAGVEASALDAGAQVLHANAQACVFCHRSSSL